MPNSSIQHSTHFNPRSREGSDVIIMILSNFVFNFNPRSREGSDVYPAGFFVSTTLFQSTLPRGERRSAGNCSVNCTRISIHAPARGATSDRLPQLSLSSNFNPRSREGSDLSSSGTSSIQSRNFNPRSREGSDKQRDRKQESRIYFNPRSREGSDRYILQDFLFPLLYFNPRSREGSDAANESTKFGRWYFNPRSREGSDGKIPRLTHIINNFNPRSREGSDSAFRGSRLSIAISIHAPARGAT